MMSIQRHIRRILREENTLPNLIRRRFRQKELDKLVSNVKRTFETHRISKQHREDVIDAEVDDFIMNSVYYGEFEDFDDEIYQDIYNQYREPLVDYIKSKIDMNLQESIRRILREEDKRQRYHKSTDSLRKVITLFLNNYIEDGDRKIGKKSRNYGNLREDWCVNGKEVITAIYYYEDGKFYSGSLLVTKTLIEKIMKIFNVRKNFLMSVVEEWYEDTMIPKFEQIVGETGFYFDDVDLFDRDHDCIPEPVKPEDITDEEMIEFIVSNTLYRRDEVINQIESGERDLEDFYLDIVHTVENKKRY